MVLGAKIKYRFALATELNQQSRSPRRREADSNGIGNASEMRRKCVLLNSRLNTHNQFVGGLVVIKGRAVVF